MVILFSLDQVLDSGTTKLLYISEALPKQFLVTHITPKPPSSSSALSLVFMYHSIYCGDLSLKCGPIETLQQNTQLKLHEAIPDGWRAACTLQKKGAPLWFGPPAAN